MQRLSHVWNDICDLVIRPQRAEYELEHLGPKLFRVGSGSVFERVDCEVVNPRGLVMQCSHFQPAGKYRKLTKLPCVIYLHGNCGSRLDALECVTLLLPNDITVFAFDFSGSGLSEGDFVSLGHFETQDLSAVVDFLLSSGKVSKIGLWGRSMGAVTSIMYGSRDPTVSAIVADSPYSSLNQVMVELVNSYKSWIPRAATKLAIKAVRQAILSRASFDINDLNTVPCARNCHMPIIVAHADGDDFVSIAHSKLVAAEYGAKNDFLHFEGDHNSERPDFFLAAVCSFFVRYLIPTIDTVCDSNASGESRVSSGDARWGENHSSDADKKHNENCEVAQAPKEANCDNGEESAEDEDDKIQLCIVGESNTSSDSPDENVEVSTTSSESAFP